MHNPINFNWIKSQFPTLVDLQELGQGGSKVVYAASSSDFGNVVLKLIRPGTDVEIVRREIAAVSCVNSERVPRVLDSGLLCTPFGEFFWLIEQRVFGSTLTQRIKIRTLDCDELLRLAEDVLSALCDAESQNIIHRDVKPDNIIVEESGRFMLLDFGIARHLNEPSLTDTSSVFGKFTPGYAPPEQFNNLKNDIDIRADLFALGVTMYESSMGVNPFVKNATEIPEILKRVEQTFLPRVNLACDTENKISDFISVLSQKRRDQRPMSAKYCSDWIQEMIIFR